jgi:chaperonin GroEL
MMDGHIDHLVTELGTYIKQVETGDDLRSIAMVSTNGDAELSECVTNAVLSGGKYGHVACTIRNTPGIELVKHSGYVFGSGIRNREFVNSGASGCLVENVYYLIAEKHIATASQISHIAQSLIDAETSDDDSQPFFLAIIGGDFSDSFKTQIVSSFVDQTKLCRCLFIDYGTIMPEKRKFVLDDLAAVTGATIIPADTTSWKSITHMSLGYSGSMYSDPEKTVIQAINSENAEEYKYYVDAVQNRIAALNEIKEKAGDQYRISLCEESIGMLSGGLQEIRIGAHSETELFERRDRADDAIRACKSALESGFLAGGGTVLLGLAENGSFYDEFADIMRYPATVIARNAEITMEEHIKNVTEKGVIDPAGVVIGAIKNSWSVVKQAIRCECMITED